MNSSQPPSSSHFTPKRLLFAGAILAAIITVTVVSRPEPGEEKPAPLAKSPPVAVSPGADATARQQQPQRPSADQPLSPPVAATSAASPAAVTPAAVAPGAEIPPMDVNAPPPTRVGYAQPPAQSGEPATASVSLPNGQTLQLSPNQIGNFQRVFVGPAVEVPVKVNYPQAQPGDVVAVAVEDGGRIAESGAVAHSGKLDADRALAFRFVATDMIGTHRVVLRKGADVKQLDFWVGSELPVARNR